MINESLERLRLYNVSAIAAVNPITGANAAIVQDTGDTARTCRDLGLTVPDAREYVQFAAFSAVRQHAECLLTLDLAETMLARVNDFIPQTVRTFRQRDSGSAIGLIRVLRELLEEEVSIRDLPLILNILCPVQRVSHADANELIIFLNDPTDVHIAAPEKRSISELDVRDYTACFRMA